MKHLSKEGLRRCCVCKNTMTLSSENFYKNSSVSTGYGYRCKECDKKRIKMGYTKEYRKLNKKQTRRRKENIKYFGSVYVLKCEGYHKIGCSKVGLVNGRIERLRSGNPFEIKYLFHYDVKDRFKYERDLHIKFNYKRIRSEWFNLNKEDIKYIHEFLSDK